jgi:hypothetical protein
MENLIQDILIQELKGLSAQAKQEIRIKPSFVPFSGKGFVVVFLGLVVCVGSFLFRFPILSIGSLVRYVQFQ